MKLLLQGGAKVEPRTAKTGATPLLLAARWGHTAVVNLLLAAGSSPNSARPSDVATPLCVAAAEGHRQVVEVRGSPG